MAGLVTEFGFTTRGEVDGLEVGGVGLDSAETEPGDLFVGMPGARVHGAQFAPQAAEAGALAILTDESGAGLAAGSGLPVIVTPDVRAALGPVAAWVYRTDQNQATLYAVTGTNGKTSTVYLVEGILKQLGLVTGLSSTAERHIGDLSVVSGLTTPEASELHALLARMRESEVRAVAIEVSAQALSRNRVDGIVFDVVAFTNLSHDHLDDYADMDEYYRAKLALFDPERGRRGVVSLDSAWGTRIVDDSRIPVTTISSVPGTDAAWSVEVLEQNSQNTAFRLTGPEGRSLTSTVPIIGTHMAANAGLAIVMLVEGGFELEAIDHAIHDGIDAYLPGRTERVSGDEGPTVYVDFGHSADAFVNTLRAVRLVTSGRVIMLFGADGDRDATKRHEMGRVASEYSDIVVVTDHHPRFENPESIRKTLIEGAGLAEHQAELHEVSPPELAIRHAVSLARVGDSILWAGPGHQNYREIEGVHTPYSARAEARAALREAGWQ